jgi:tRNA (adenine57-N1/adenine58-N1)-methyltransferase
VATGDPFAYGDACLLYDAKGRRYLIELELDREFHSHRGLLAHADIVGSPEGARLETSRGSELTVLRPRLADYVLKMGRAATVLYPKDAGAILMWADIGPGTIVLEAGTGSGGLAMVLARAVLPGGRVVSVERREDHAAVARKRIAGFFGDVPEHLDLRVGEVADVIADVGPDRIVLDVPEPWRIVDLAAEHLPGGGIFACYLPNITQVQEVGEALSATGSFMESSTFEVLMRDWVIGGRSLRPSHRMVGHTGWITVARKHLGGDPADRQAETRS